MKHFESYNQDKHGHNCQLPANYMVMKKVGIHSYLVKTYDAKCPDTKKRLHQSAKQPLDTIATVQEGADL